jgi:hypothetical protein
MADWWTWQNIADTAAKIGLGGLALWGLQRWVGSRDKAVERGRARVEAARPEVIPTGGSFSWAAIGFWQLRSRGAGNAYDITVEFTGSAKIVRLSELETGTERMTPEVDLSDSPFFREPSSDAGTLTVRYRDRFANEYITRLPVVQDKRADGRFNMRPEYGKHVVSEPQIAKKRLRQIGGS